MIPIIKQTIIRLVPPALIKGRVNPFVGKSPQATPTFIKVCNPSNKATPYEK